MAYSVSEPFFNVRSVSSTVVCFPVGMIIIKLSLSSESLSVIKKIVLVVYASFLIILGTFIFGNSLVYTVMHDIGLF